ncbi:MAG: thiol oxidoreductase [Azonexaceae bacterium]|nr:thiol oxidoreductase [Azonexaceae bacterium]
MLLAACVLPAQADDALREAYTHPLPGLADSDRETFFRGRGLFRQSWVVAPAEDRAAGLGPLYNRLSCISCHQKNGRGRSPDGPDERMLSMLVRLSVPGKAADGGPKAHPAYGGQLNEEGIAGVPGEGRAALSWVETKPITLAGGEKVSFRRPQIRFVELAYGPMGKVLTSPRIGQPVYGLGLLEAVPDATLLTMAAENKADGVRGRVNRVWDAAAKQTVIGRFGFKSNQPNLRQQIAGAMVGDLGITSTLFPDENCTPAQKACQKAPSAGHPELSDADLDAMEFYLANIAPPSRRNADDPQVRAGERQFASLGCASCHRPELQTGPNQRFPLTANQRIAPYTDLLIHDMGQGLADGRPDFQATGREWRTPPLWGIGLVPLVNEHSQFLHDGRARNLQEAILWHGGEARTARQRYVATKPEARKALLAFLESL